MLVPPDALDAPVQSLTSIVSPSRMRGMSESSAADSRTLSRSPPGFSMLKMRNCSSFMSGLRSPPSGPSMLTPPNPTAAKSIAGPLPFTSASPPGAPRRPRSTRGRSPPAPVRTKTTTGRPLAGTARRGTVTTKFASLSRCTTGVPEVSKIHVPPLRAYGGVPDW